MTTMTVNSDDARSIRAVEIAAGSGQWIRCRTRDGQQVYGVPSQCARKAGRYYLVTASACDCEDAKRHGLSSGRIGQQGLHSPCKHQLAVRLREALASGAWHVPARQHAFTPHVNGSGETIWLPQRITNVISDAEAESIMGRL